MDDDELLKDNALPLPKIGWTDRYYPGEPGEER